MANPLEDVEAGVADVPPTFSYAEILRSFWQRKWLVLLGMVLGLVGSALYYARCIPLYEANAQVLLVQKRADPSSMIGPGLNLSGYEDYAATHLVLIRSPLIIREAVEKEKLGALASFAGPSDPTGAIIRSLTVSRDANSGTGPSAILDLSYRGPVPEDCAVVLNAVIATYRDFLENTYRTNGNDTLKLLTQKVDELQAKLEEKENKYRQLRMQSPVLLLKGKDGRGLSQEHLAALMAEKSSLLLRRTRVDAQLAELAQAKKEGRSRQELLDMIAAWTERGRTAEAKLSTAAPADDPLLPLVLEEKTLLLDYGPQHPKVQQVRQRIQMTRELLAHAAKGSALTQGDAPPSGDPVEEYAHSQNQELKDIAALEGQLTQVLEHEVAEAKKQGDVDFADSQYGQDIERTRQFHDSLLKQLEGVSLVKDLGGYDARTLSPASDGGKIGPSGSRIFGLGCLAGILLGLGLAYLAELSDNSFRSPEDIRRRLRLPVVGHIPELTPPADGSKPAVPLDASLDPTLCSHHHPKSTGAEAFRGVRTALYFSVNSSQHKVIQITSPAVGDGKSTLAANLAISIAQSRKKTLLIDADFRRPRQHQLFRLSPKLGLASVIDGEAELSEAIQPTAVPGLSILPCGPRPFNPAELLTLPRFKELLDVLRDQYDFVLLDTPPLLAVSDPSIVVSHVDGVLLIVRVSKHGRPEAERARETLLTLGANILGVIVNGVDCGSRYGRYGFGSRYYHQYDSRYQHRYNGDPEETPLAALEAAESNGQIPGSGEQSASSDSLDTPLHQPPK